MPYREEKPLADIIPPDRRREKMVALVVIGMVMGAGVLYALQQVTKDAPTVVSTATPPKVMPFSVATLSGPDGTFTIPTRGKRTVVHVWLQACADCMPAFEAMKKIANEGELAPNVVNVAYGTADPSWAEEYGVRKNLVFDPGGSKVVHPLGITSFTTIVFDEEGAILAKDRPDRPGYVERIRALVNPAPLEADDVRDVVSRKHAELRRRCWDKQDLSHASLTVETVIGGDGRVVDATAKGDNPELDRCIAEQVKGWRFRPTGRASVPVSIPFKFVRQ